MRKIFNTIKSIAKFLAEWYMFVAATIMGVAFMIHFYLGYPHNATTDSMGPIPFAAIGLFLGFSGGFILSTMLRFLIPGIFRGLWSFAKGFAESITRSSMKY